MDQIVERDLVAFAEDDLRPRVTQPALRAAQSFLLGHRKVQALELLALGEDEAEQQAKQTERELNCAHCAPSLADSSH